MTRTYHIILADPSEIVVTGLKSLLKRLGLQLEISDTCSVDDMVAMIQSRNPDVVIMNPSFLPDSTLSKPGEFFQNADKTAYAAITYSFLDKKTASLFDEIIYITDTVLELKDKIKKLLSKPDKLKDEKKNVHLTQRETEVLKMVVLGYSNKEIADKLFISQHTVITHRKNITAKLGIKSVAGLTVYAILNKLVEDTDLEHYKNQK